MKYEFECKLDDKIYYEFNKYHLQSAPDIKKSIFWLKVTVPVILFLILLLEFLFNTDVFFVVWMTCWFAIVSILWIFFAERAMTSSVKFQMKLMKKTGKMPYAPVATMQFFDDYFIEMTPENKTEVKYTGIDRICVYGEKMVCIYTNAILAYIIPFEAFESDEQREGFLEFINNKIKNNQ